MATTEEIELAKAFDRGKPLVVSFVRWIGLVLAGSIVLVFLPYLYIHLSHSPRTLGSYAPGIGAAVALFSLLAWATLKSEESRIARELRMARSGSALIRSRINMRRQRAPLIGRLLSCTYGQAALYLSEGDRDSAIHAVSSNSLVMNGGRLQWLKDVVEADIERSTGTSYGLERALAGLWDKEPSGNREADCYKTHVLVKTVLQQADADRAEELAKKLAASDDDEQSVYATWLETWFGIELDEPSNEGAIRMALLLARSQGAEDLVVKLEERLAGKTAGPTKSGDPSAPTNED